MRKYGPITKTRLSSDWGLQPDPTKLDSLVIAHQPWRGEYVPWRQDGYHSYSEKMIEISNGSSVHPAFLCLLSLFIYGNEYT